MGNIITFDRNRVKVKMKDAKLIGTHSIKMNLEDGDMELEIKAASVLIPSFMEGCIDGCIESLNNVELSEKELQIIVDRFTIMRDNIDKFIRQNTRW